MAEKIYYNRDDVRISTSRAIFGVNTYAVNGITSFRKVMIRPNRLLPAFTILGGSCFAGAFGAVGFGIYQHTSERVERTDLWLLVGISCFLALVGIAMLAGSIWWLLEQKPTYLVIICTAAGERKAHATTNGAEANEVVAALNEALIDQC